MNIFEEFESEVRSYCRKYDVMFNRAKGSKIYSDSGEAYIDFLAGAGALNYGHNNDYIKEKIISYLENDYIAHGLDMFTKAKEQFIEKFTDRQIISKNFDYKIQFSGPTGTNAVEAAVKLARKAKGRSGIFSFMGGFHGMTLGSLSLSGNKSNRAAAGTSLQNNVTFIPYPGFMPDIDSIDYMERILNDTHSGIEKPAAIIFETIQAEGGINVAPVDWLRRLRDLCDKHDILLICDDIQVGCGRTGSFYSFERAGIEPDIVTISKSISGYGFPMSLVLMKRKLDVWQPADHTGTFRGNQIAFVAASAALDLRDKLNLKEQVKEKEKIIKTFLEDKIVPLNEKIGFRGLGMIWGLDFSKFDEDLTDQIISDCFDQGLIIESAGRNDSVLKILPPLTIEKDLLEQGLNTLKAAISKLVVS